MISKFRKSGETLMALIIITLFAFSVLLLVLAGISSYKKVTENAENSAELRSTLIYISNKLKSGDSAGAISLQNIGETQVLSIKKEIDKDTYCDCIYCRNGALYEQLIAKGDTLKPENGDLITKISALKIEDNNGLFKITAKTQSGSEKQTYLNLRSEDK